MKEAKLKELLCLLIDQYTLPPEIVRQLLARILLVLQNNKDTQRRDTL